MKNVHLIPTDKPTWLHKSTLTGVLRKSSSCIDDMKQAQGMNIYITSDETAYPYALHYQKEVLKIRAVGENSGELYHDKGFSYPDQCKKIILTTDQDLIDDGVQAIDDEFLEWFVKNPSCEEVEVKKEYITPLGDIVETCYDNERLNYQIIIPKEIGFKVENGKRTETFYQEIPELGTKEFTDLASVYFGGKPKQETLEEAAEKFAKKFGSEIDSTRYYAFINGAKWQKERMYSEEEVLRIITSCKEYLSFGDEFNEKEWFEQVKKK